MATGFGSEDGLRAELRAEGRTIGTKSFWLTLIASLAAPMVAQAAATRTTSTATSATEPGLAQDDSFDFDFDEFDDVEAPRLFIESIEIVGNEKTARGAILQRILVNVGDVVDDDQVEKSRLRLLGTGYFRSVEFSLKRGSKRGLVVLVIDIEERNTITLDGPYFGWSDVSPFFFGLGVLESNFLGKGVSAGGGFVLGENRRAFDLNIFIPDLGNTPLSLSASAIWVESGRETLVAADPSIGELEYSRVGGAAGLGFRAGTAQRIALEYRLETIQVDRLPNLSPDIIRQAPSIQFDESILSTVSLTFERDTLDDALVPTSGHRVTLAVEVGTRLLGSSYEFSRYTGEGLLALPAWSDHSINLTLTGGFIQGNTPFFNQFFLRDHAYFVGGERSLPRVLEVNFSPANDYDDLLLSGGVVYNIPIQRGGAFFYGTYVYLGTRVGATASLDELQEDPDGRGAGNRFPLSADAGLRLDTYLGSFSLSVAYVVDLLAQ